jgi:hypothetical protein
LLQWFDELASGSNPSIRFATHISDVINRTGWAALLFLLLSTAVCNSLFFNLKLEFSILGNKMMLDRIIFLGA